MPLRGIGGNMNMKDVLVVIIATILIVWWEVKLYEFINQDSPPTTPTIRPVVREETLCPEYDYACRCIERCKEVGEFGEYVEYFNSCFCKVEMEDYE
jgi:hypothetical protein